MSIVDSTPLTIPNERFPSLAALRAAHSDLLQMHRTQGDATDVLNAIQRFIVQARDTGALLDNEADRATAQSLLDYWSTILYRAGQPDSDVLLEEFDSTLAPELADELCPFVGLNAFQERNGQLFFGRQHLTDTILHKLSGEQLVAVVGPSGSGKSSLVLAGVLPALKQGALPATADTPGSQDWRYAGRMVPGSDPLANLVRLVQAVAVVEALPMPADIAAWTLEQVNQLRTNPQHLVDLAAQTGAVPIVLVVDQFEELFTLCTDEPARQAFVANLTGLVQTAAPRHRVMLTMRTDFEAQIARLPTFQPLFEQALVRVTPLSAAELRQAIEQPAALIGLKFESGLIDQLLQDVLGEPAALPLLQFTLLKLWETRDHNRITWEAYKRLGGGRLALARCADQFYNNLIPEEQVTARRILLRLVRPSEGLETTSNRVRLVTLYQSGEARDRVDRVLQKLIDAHLVRISEGDTSVDTQIEVAHEALVRNWPRLVEWVEEERDNLRQRLRLTEAAEQWVKLNRDPGALLRGALLEAVQNYPDLNALETEFVQASRVALEAAEQEKEAVRQRELAQAQALAEEQRLRAQQAALAARQRGLLSTGLIIVAVLLAGAATLAGFQATSDRVIALQHQATVEAAGTQEAAARQTAEAAGMQEAFARETAVAERLISQNEKATLAANLSLLLTAVTVDLVGTPTPLPWTPAPVYPAPPGPTTPMPETPEATSSDGGGQGVLPETATATPEATQATPVYPSVVIAAQAQVDAVQATQTRLAELPTPVVKIVQTGANTTADLLQENLVFQVVAYDPATGSQDGAGIDFVKMLILNSQGDAVYQKVEHTAQYCAFGGGEPTCNSLALAGQPQWPSTDAPLQPGVYTLQAIVYALNGTHTEVEKRVTLKF
ncbi:MAG: hypothetical protein U0350_13530 [Caldilineaceae bacterium]